MQSWTVRCICFMAISMTLSLCAQEQIINGDTLRIFTITERLDQGSQVFQQKLIHLDKMAADLDLKGALGDQTSIYIKDGGPGVLASSGFRAGTAQQQVLLWNGMMVNSSSLGLTDLSVLPSFLFDEVEFSNGPGSLIKGDGILGMAIDMRSTGNINQEGLNVHFRTVPAFEEVYESISYSKRMGRSSFDIGAYKGQAENRYAYLDYSEFIPAMRKRSHAAQDMWGLKTDIVHRSLKNGRYQLSVQKSSMFREVPAVLGTVNRAEELEDVHTRAMLIWNDRFAGFETELAIGISHEEQMYSDSLSNLSSEIDGQYVHRRFILSKEFKSLGKFKLKWNADKAEVNTQNYAETQERVLLGAFLEWEKSWKNIAINASIRQAWVDAETIPNTGAIGLRYTYARCYIHSSVGRTYRIPTFNDLYWNPGGNPSLSPEQGWTGQLGLGRQADKGNIGITYFRNDMQDMIVWVPTEASYWSPVNRTHLTAQGIELEAQWTFATNWEMNSSLTWTDIVQWKEGNKDYGLAGLMPLYVPRIIAVYGVTYSDEKNRVSLAQRINGQVFSDNSNTFSVEQSTPMKLSYSRTFVSQWTQVDMGLSINNLLNENYELIRGRPLPRRCLQFDIIIHLKTERV
jgi:vitamin B12 transporter